MLYDCNTRQQQKLFTSCLFSYFKTVVKVKAIYVTCIWYMRAPCNVCAARGPQLPSVSSWSHNMHS